MTAGPVADDGLLDSATLRGLAELGLGPQPLPRLEAMVAATVERLADAVRVAAG